MVVAHVHQLAYPVARLLSAKGCRSSSAGCMDAGAPLVHGRHGRGPMLGCGRSAAPAASGRRTTRVASRCGLCLLCVDSVCVRWCMARYAYRRIATVGSRTRATRRMSTSQSARSVAARFRSIYVTVTQVTLTHVAASPASRHPGVGARPAPPAVRLASSARAGSHRGGRAVPCGNALTSSRAQGALLIPNIHTLAHVTRLSLLETHRSTLQTRARNATNPLE